MARARIGSKVQSRLSILVYGKKGTGKSTFGLGMMYLKTPEGRPYRVLAIDTEAGGLDDGLQELEENGIDLRNLYIVYTQSLQETKEYIRKATNKEDFMVLDEEGNETGEIVTDSLGEPFRPDAILVDSVSVLKMTSQQSLLDLARKRAKVKSNKAGLVGDEKMLAITDVNLAVRDYGTLNYSGQSLVLDLSASNLSYIVTAREKEKTENRMVDGKSETVVTGYTYEGYKDMDFNVKTILRMYRDEDDYGTVKMMCEKDRTKTYEWGAEIENPSVVDFQAVLNKNLGHEFVIKNTMEESIQTDSTMYQRSLGIEDESKNEERKEETNNISSDKDAIKNLKDQIKVYVRKITNNTDLKHELGDTLKSKGLPTSFSKVEDLSVLSEVLSVCKEVVDK